MASSYMTPGVYIEEKNAFPASVVAVETAVPVFIGYTEIATKDGKSLLNTALKVSSFTEFITYFGNAFNPKYVIALFVPTPATTEVTATETTVAKPASTPPADCLKIGDKYYTVKIKNNHSYYLYNSMRLFYANGGGDCYILCVGTYGGLPDGVDTPTAKSFTDVLTVLEKELEPTLVVMPDAVNFTNECYNSIYTEVLAHCNKMQSRFAIFDLLQETEYNEQTGTTADFRTLIGVNFLNYGAAYYPWLKTTVVDASQVDFNNIALASIDDITNYLPNTETGVPAVIAKYKTDIAKAGEDVNDPVAKAEAISTINKNFHQALKAVSPTYIAILKEINAKMNVLPPSGAIAGIYTMVDTTKGVWKAPANCSLSMVNGPVINITAAQQDNLNIDPIAGKSINIIRLFPELGTLIWGGRTLDGNSQDWRYINVRRTLIMIEQSLKLATRAYVFEPNDSNLWNAIKTMYANFLTNLWKQGALAGAAPEQAFNVLVGLGTTMTASDILDGWLKITVLLAVVRPAEFIVITFQQQQQQS